MNEQNFSKKWFWIGIIIAFIHALAGLIYGIVLLFKKKYRKEGLIIIVFAVVWGSLIYFIIGPWLIDRMAAKGLLISELNIKQTQFPQKLQ